MPPLTNFNRNTTVGDLLDAAEDMNAASVRVTGRTGDDRPLWTVIAVSGPDAWKYLLACEVLELDDQATHEEVLAVLSAIQKKYL